MSKGGSDGSHNLKVVGSNPTPATKLSVNDATSQFSPYIQKIKYICSYGLLALCSIEKAWENNGASFSAP